MAALFTCCADLLLGFSFFSLGSLLHAVSWAEEEAAAGMCSVLMSDVAGAGMYVCLSLSQYRYC